MSESQYAGGAAVPRVSHGIIKKFMQLLGAQWFKDTLNTVFLVYLARVGTTTYGEFMLGIELGFIVLFLGEFGLNQALVTDLGKKYASKGDVLARYSLLKAVLLFLAMSGACIFSLSQSYTPHLFSLVMLLATGYSIEALASSFFISCRVNERQDLEAMVRMVACVMGYGYGFGMLLLGAPPLLVALFKVVENSVNLAGAAYVTLSKRDLRTFRLRRKAMTRTWRTAQAGLAFVCIALCGILYNKANVFFLQKYGGSTFVAQYSAAWMTVEGITVLISNILLRNVLYPLLVKLWNNDPQAYRVLIKKAVRWLLCAAFPAMFVLCVESDRIIGLIYGADYADAMWMQKYMVPALLFSFVHNFCAYIMMSRGKVRLLLSYYVVGLVLNLGLCIMLMPQWPLLGGVLAIVLTRAGMTVMTLGYCQLTMRLIDLKGLLPLAGALAVSTAVWLSLAHIGIREVRELATLAPMLALAWFWWQKEKSKAAATPAALS